MLYNSAVCLLDKAAQKYPENIALSDENSSVTYKEYRQLSIKIASALTELKRDDFQPSPIIVCMKKSYFPIIAFMGILYSANAYVPVPADVPKARLLKIIEKLEAKLIICDENTQENVNDCGIDTVLFSDLVNHSADEEKIQDILGEVIDTDAAYMIFTSGSTGTPKGVTVCHRSIIDYAQWTSTQFGFTSKDVLGNQAPFYFDNSVFDIYTALITGAKLVIIPEVLYMFPSKLPEFVRDNEITSIFWVPTVMLNVAYSKALESVKMPKLKRVLFAGEVMPNSALNIWRRAIPDVLYANLYGPTEITDVCIFYVVDREFDDNEPLPIGKACRNMRAIILNQDMQKAKPHEKGELYIGGTGVALGYYNSPDITEKAFVQNPLNNKYRDLLYKTGDIAYYDDRGLIMYCGRIDAQIKLKGNRIELGEIETGACCIEGIENACALFDAPNEKIVLIVESTQELKLRKVNLELKKYIPAYMLPGQLEVLEKMPHTPSGKIDRVKLKNQYINSEGK